MATAILAEPDDRPVAFRNGFATSLDVLNTSAVTPAAAVATWTVPTPIVGTDALVALSAAVASWTVPTITPATDIVVTAPSAIWSTSPGWVVPGVTVLAAFEATAGAAISTWNVLSAAAIREDETIAYTGQVYPV